MYNARVRAQLSRCVADALLAGVWNERALADRIGRVLEPRPDWRRTVAREVLSAYRRPPADRPRELARFVALRLHDLPPAEDPEPPRARRWLIPVPAMGPRRWPVPELASTGELARWLGLGDGELAWLADVRGLERQAPDERLRHYRYATLARAGRPARVIERPKARLKAIQRRILHEILDWIPAHPAAHGFTRGRSVQTHAREHAGRYVVVRIDLADFFASIAAARIYGIFRTAGYPESVAHALTGLSTNVAAAAAWQAVPRPSDARQHGAHHRLGRQLATPHLPQGAPTSPALANLAAFGLDRRLRGLAAATGAHYSRYADDLTFSGPPSLVRGAQRVRAAVATIAAEEGFRVNPDKSTLVTRAGRQRVCGVVVNAHPNLARAEYDVLKAILHNARVHGPETQNRHGVADFRAHLQGRIAWVASLNPSRGESLHRAFAAITWAEPDSLRHR